MQSAGQLGRENQSVAGRKSWSASKRGKFSHISFLAVMISCFMPVSFSFASFMGIYAFLLLIDVRLRIQKFGEERLREEGERERERRENISLISQNLIAVYTSGTI